MTSKTKPRILYMWELLKKTDESHTLSTNQLIAQLKTKYDIDAHRTTISRDVEDLVEFGVDIITIHSTQNRYYIASGNFEKPELQLLINAVESSKLITKKKSAALIKKIYNLTNPYEAEKLKSFHNLNSRVKPYNENIYYISDEINEAIARNAKIAFTYYQYTTNKKIEFKNDGREYIVSPYDMMWVGDYFYMFGYSEKHQKIATFRVDRIYKKPRILDQKRRPLPEGYDFDEFIKESFMAYEGEKVKIKLRFDNQIMNAIIDNFGKDVHIVESRDGHSVIETDVMLSPTFFSWIFCLRDKIQIISPKNAIDEYKKMLQIGNQIYK